MIVRSNFFQYGELGERIAGIRDSEIHKDSANEILNMTITEVNTLRVAKRYSRMNSTVEKIIRVIDTKYNFYIVVTFSQIITFSRDNQVIASLIHGLSVNENTNVNVLKVLTTKLNVWKHEAEYRYLKPNTCNLNQIGNIVKIYIGNPYNNINNESNVLRNNQVLQKYRILKAELEKFLRDKNIEFVEVYVENNIVVEREINS